MPYEIPSVDNITDFFVAAHKGKDSRANYNKHSALRRLARARALSLADGHYQLYLNGADAMPDTAREEALDRWLNLFGIPRRGAVGAARSAAWRVTGTSGATVPSDRSLTHVASGLTFETRSSGTIPSGGYLDVDIAATSTGAQTNLEVGEELRWDSVPTDLDDTASLVLELRDGRDAELDEAASARLAARIAEGNAGGNRNDWEHWAIESAPYVESAYIYRHRRGLGTLDVAALKAGSGSARLLGATERAEVDAYLLGLRPILSVHRILEVTQTAVNVEAVVKPLSSYEWDWDDSTPPTFSAYDAGTRIVTFGADRPADMAAGDRLAFDLDGTEYTIEALSSTDAVILSSDLLVVPAGGTECYSGAAFTAAARDAVLALFDTLGPANPDGSSYGDWEGNLRVNAVRAAIDQIDGVLDVTMVTPTFNVQATDYPYPSDDSIDHLIAGWVVVRRDWS